MKPADCTCAWDAGWYYRNPKCPVHRVNLLCSAGCGSREPWGGDPKDARPGALCNTPGCGGTLRPDPREEEEPEELIVAEPPAHILEQIVGAAPSPIREEVIEVGDNVLPSDSRARKGVPLARGVLDYFPGALMAVAMLSQAGNDKHNPGEELHHARGKSTDHPDCIMRHLVDRGTVDPDDPPEVPLMARLHSTKVAWRALAMLQEELEGLGLVPKARGAR